MWQGIIVAIIVIGAAYYVLRRYKKALNPGGGGCGCGCGDGKGGCSADSGQCCPSGPQSMDSKHEGNKPD